MSWRFWRLNLTTRFFKIRPLISLMVIELHFQLAQAKVECEMVWRGLCYKIDAVSEGGTHARRLLFGDLGWSCIGSRRAELRFEEARSDDGCFSTFASAPMDLWTETTGTTKETAKEKPEVLFSTTHLWKTVFLVVGRIPGNFAHLFSDCCLMMPFLKLTYGLDNWEGGF